MYILLDNKGIEVKKLDAPCYTDALVMVLFSLGYKLEATEKEQKEIIDSHKEKEITEHHPNEIISIPSTEAVKIIVKDVVVEKKPFTYKNLEIYNFLKEPHTIEEIVAKTGVAVATAKLFVGSLAKRCGYKVKQQAMPGVNGILYSMED